MTKAIRLYITRARDGKIERLALPSRKGVPYLDLFLGYGYVVTASGCEEGAMVAHLEPGPRLRRMS
jgi:hypothetical protein